MCLYSVDERAIRVIETAVFRSRLQIAKMFAFLLAGRTDDSRTPLMTLARTAYLFGRRALAATSLFTIISGGFHGTAGVARANEMHRSIRGSITPPARDPERAVEEEYEMARQQGTREALELFIARHPESPLTEKARAALRRLAK